MFKAMILKTVNMNGYRQGTTKMVCKLSALLFCLRKEKKKKQLGSLKCPFHGRLESIGNVFSRNQPSNNAGRTATQRFLSVSISQKKAFSAPALSLCITPTAWTGQMTQEFHSAAAAV